jgi:hypothetical protein
MPTLSRLLHCVEDYLSISNLLSSTFARRLMVDGKVDTVNDGLFEGWFSLFYDDSLL